MTVNLVSASMPNSSGGSGRDNHFRLSSKIWWPLRGDSRKRKPLQLAVSKACVISSAMICSTYPGPRLLAAFATRSRENGPASSGAGRFWRGFQQTGQVVRHPTHDQPAQAVLAHIAAITGAPQSLNGMRKATFSKPTK